MIISILMCVFLLIGTYKVFEKAGEAGWKSLIPFYNVYILYKISGMSKGKTMFMIFSPLIIGVLFAISFASTIGSLLSGSVSSYGMTSTATTMGGASVIVSLISFAISIVMMVFSFQQTKSLALKFGKTTGFGVGLWLLAPVFYAILGFGKDVYVGDYANTSYGFNGNQGDTNSMYGTNNINNQNNPYVNNINDNQNNIYNEAPETVNEPISDINIQSEITPVSEVNSNNYNSYNEVSETVNESTNDINIQSEINNNINITPTLENNNNSESLYGELNSNEISGEPIFDIHDDNEPVVQINDSNNNEPVVENRFGDIFNNDSDKNVPVNTNNIDNSNSLFNDVKPVMGEFNNKIDNDENVETKTSSSVIENVNNDVNRSNSEEEIIDIVDGGTSIPNVNYAEKVDNSNPEMISNDINMVDVSFNDSNDNQEIL